MNKELSALSSMFNVYHWLLLAAQTLRVQRVHRVVSLHDDFASDSFAALTQSTARMRSGSKGLG